MLYDTTRERHYCRNSSCRLRLPAPVDYPRDAFCTRGCHSSFYRSRCLVCETPIEQPKRGARQLCEKAACRNALRVGSGLGRYHASSGAESKSETPDFIGSKLALESDRPSPLAWRRIAGPELPEINLRIPLDGAFAVRTARANNAHWERAALIGWSDPPVNILGGYRFPHAPQIGIATPKIITTPAVTTDPAPIPGDLSIPEFMQRQAR
jgi:hypothetical protein